MTEGVVTPLRFEDTNFSLRTIVPTKAEIYECNHLDMTSYASWEPSEFSGGNTPMTQQSIFSVNIDA